MADPKTFALEFNYCPCEGCDRTLRKVRAIEGVHSMRVDEKKRKLTISGPVDPETVIERIEGRGKRAKLFREEEVESPPEINHQEMPIVLQQNPVRTFLNQQKVVPMLPGNIKSIVLQQNPVRTFLNQQKVVPMLPDLIVEPVDKPMGERNHDCAKDGHELELKVYNKPFKCNGCKEDGLTSGHRCKHCVYDLHEDCKDPKPEVTHVFFKGSKFKFRQKPGNICDACGMEIHGHSYSCEEDSLDLHPACSKLPLCIFGTDFELSSEVEYKCFCCNLKKPRWLAETGIRGLCYVSKRKKFSCHVHCVSQVTQEAWKRGDLDCDRGDNNDGISKTLTNVDRKPVTNVKRSGGKGGNLFLKVVSILLKTVIGVLFGDPTGLIVSVFTELGKELLTL